MKIICTTGSAVLSSEDKSAIGVICSHERTDMNNAREFLLEALVDFPDDQDSRMPLSGGSTGLFRKQ